METIQLTEDREEQVEKVLKVYSRTAHPSVAAELLYWLIAPPAPHMIKSSV